MPSKSYDVNFPEERRQTKERIIYVIDVPTSKDSSELKALPFEEALREIGEGQATISCLVDQPVLSAKTDSPSILGFGKVQVQLMCLIGMILITVLTETMGVSFLIPAAQCDLNLSVTDKGLLSGMTYFGNTFQLLLQLPSNNGDAKLLTFVS